MESLNDKLMYAKVSENIRGNIECINKLLEDCAFSSRISSEETKISKPKYLSIETEKFINNFPKADYYDLDLASKIFEMLETSNPENKKKAKLNFRSESVTSLASSSGLSSEDVTQLHEDNQEFQSHLTKIRTVLESISDFIIKVPDLHSIKDKETSTNTSFVDLVMSLQKLAKEMQNIASSDTVRDEQESFNIDGKLVYGLTLLTQVSSMT
jgi:hypothetical protein